MRMKFKCPMDEYHEEKSVVGMRNMQPYHRDKVARMFFSHNKDMKFLLSVRNPVDRTFSQYGARLHARRARKGDNGSRITFDINREMGIEQPHVRKTLIHSLLQPYLDLFPPEQFFIYPMELMVQDTKHWMNKVFAFLGVAQDSPLHDTQELANPGRYDVADFVPMNAESKRHLIELCLDDTEAMSELSGIDLVKLWGLQSHLHVAGPTASPLSTR